MTPLPGGHRETHWARTVDRIVRGEHVARFVRLGPTPGVLRRVGLGPGDLVMSAGKIARARREHPEVPLAIWHRLPELLDFPAAAFPSDRRDGSIVVVTLAVDVDGHPIIAPILWDEQQRLNVVLSLYGRSGTARLSPYRWIDAQIQAAQADNLPVLDQRDPADAEPKPDPVSSETTSWSPGMIPADRPAGSIRKILTLPSKVKK